MNAGDTNHLLTGMIYTFFHPRTCPSLKVASDFNTVISTF